MPLIGTPVKNPSASDVLTGADVDTGPATIAEAISAVALGPSSVTVAGETVASKNVSELIDADRYLRGIDSAKRGKLQFRLGQITPGGCG
jgi:hypothetical protein